MFVPIYAYLIKIQIDKSQISNMSIYEQRSKRWHDITLYWSN